MARGQRVGDIWEGLERAEGLEGSEDGDRERVEGCKAGGVLEFGKGLGAGWRRLGTDRVWGLGRRMVRAEGWTRAGDGRLSGWQPRKFLSRDPKCQPGYSPPHSRPPCLAAGVLIIFTAAGALGGGKAGEQPGGKPAKVEVEEAGSTHSEPRGLRERQTGFSDWGRPGGRRRAPLCARSTPQAKKWAGVVPSFPGGTEAWRRRLVWQPSGRSWDHKAQGFMGGGRVKEGGGYVWSRPLGWGH